LCRDAEAMRIAVVVGKDKLGLLICRYRKRSKYRTPCSLRFHSGCIDDALCAFALLQDEACELRLCHAHPIGPMLFQLSAQFSPA